MKKWKCQVCGYIYDPEKGDPDGNIPPNTPFEKLPDSWVCPVCGAPKDMFEEALDLDFETAICDFGLKTCLTCKNRGSRARTNGP